MKEQKRVFEALSKIEEPIKENLSAEKTDLSISNELDKLLKVAKDVESAGKELYKKQSEAEALLKRAYKLLEPLGNFYETQVEAGLKELQSAGLTNSKAYKELSSSWDYTSRANDSAKRMARAVSSAIN